MDILVDIKLVDSQIFASNDEEFENLVRKLQKRGKPKSTVSEIVRNLPNIEAVMAFPETSQKISIFNKR